MSLLKLRSMFRILLAALLLAFPGCAELTPPPSEYDSRSPAPEDSQRYLLLDDRVVERKENVRLTVGTVQKHAANPLFGEDKSWEPRFDNLYANVFYDQEEDLYRCWYNPFIVDPMVTNTPREKRGQVKYRNHNREFGIAYATSQDGLKWTKPELGLVEFEGSKANNLLLRGTHGAGIIKEPHDPRPERRYKMIYGGTWIKSWKPGVGVRFSADGLSWGEPIACPEVKANGDTHNNALWAPELGKYVGITRLYEGQRIVARMESSDFLKWTKAVEVLRGDPYNQTYAMQIFRYADLYLGLVMIIRRQEDRVHCELTWSPDTIRWERIDPGTPFIPNSTIPGEYDWGCVYAANAPIVSDQGIRVYYAGSNGPHRDWRDGSFCLATLRHDGWAGYQPVVAGQTGTIQTKMLPWRGRLQLSADAGDGSVRVSVLDKEGRVRAESQLVTGSVTDQEVTFSAEQPLAIDQEVRFQFTLDQAKLYSFVLSE